MRSRPSRLLGITCVLALALPAAQAAATTWNVPGDSSNTCTTINPSCDTIQGAIDAAVDTDDIQVAAGTYSESNLTVNKSVTINGAGVGTTIVDPAGGVGFVIQDSGITISNLTIENASQAVRFFMAGVDDTEFNTVEFLNSTSRGIEIQTTGVTNVSVIDSTFTNNNIGIRMSSASEVDGFTITGTDFDTHALAVYQANDANTSTLSGLMIDDCEFLNTTSTATIYAEEIRESVIENSTFTTNQRGIGIFKFYATSGESIGDVIIRNNQFSGSTVSSIVVVSSAAGLDAPVSIENNVINQDVSLLASNTSSIDVRISSAFTHAQVDVTGNEINLSGAFNVATVAHGIAVGGGGPFDISGNLLDGGGVGSVSTTPPSSGIYIRSTGSAGQIPATAVITGDCNEITGFVNGISVYDSVGAAYGGLLPGTTVAFEDGTISGNDDAGVRTAAAPPTIFAENVFWGCAAGPGNPGCDDVVGDVDADPFATVDLPCGVEPLTVDKLVVGAQKPGKSNGKTTGKGSFTTVPPGDTFDASAPIGISVADDASLNVGYTFPPSECTTKGTTVLKITCKSADKLSKATFKGDKNDPATFSYKFKIKGLAIDGPFAGPGAVTVTYGPGTIRTGEISTCTVKSNGLKCK